MVIKKILNKTKIFNPLRDWRYILLKKLKLKKIIITHPSPIKIIIGSGETSYNGWISTDIPFFNILKKSDWKFYFKKNSIDNLLAEHVMEHLTEEEVKKVLGLAHQYLKQGGCFRIAVPDAHHPNTTYIEYVKPGGSGPGADDHKSFWTYKSLSELAKKNDLKIDFLEYFNEHGLFISIPFSDEQGIVKRSKQNGFIFPSIPDYTSLILDLKK